MKLRRRYQPESGRNHSVKALHFKPKVGVQVYYDTMIYQKSAKRSSRNTIDVNLDHDHRTFAIRCLFSAKTIAENYKSGTLEDRLNKGRLARGDRVVESDSYLFGTLTEAQSVTDMANLD